MSELPQHVSKTNEGCGVISVCSFLVMLWDNPQIRDFSLSLLGMLGLLGNLLLLSSQDHP